MRRLITAVALVALLTFAHSSRAEKPTTKESLDALAIRAVTGCSRSSYGVCERLRSHGREGLEAVLRVKDHEGVRETRWRAAVDQVGGARYSSRSGLFWHSDFDAALAESKRTGKPILSLRMLGKLTDEYSCANSRFFRTTLYSSPQIAKAMKQQFVLHWKTVRPVPVMTIDFGDGRVLKRTITGNSAHYLLDQSGRPLDVLPGLHAPVAFERWLQAAVDLHEKYRGSDDPNLVLRQYHRAGEMRIVRALQLFRYPAGTSASDPAEHYWTTDVGLLDHTTPASLPVELRPPVTPPKAAGAVRATAIAQPKGRIESKLVKHAVNPRTLANHLKKAAAAYNQARAAESKKATSGKKTGSDAAAATRIAAPKRLVENALVRNVRPGSYRRTVVVLREAEIPKIARVHPELMRLDASTLEIMAAERSGATSDESNRKGRHEMMEQLAKGIAEDTVRNEFDFHLRVHRWFNAGDVTDVEALDQRVYDELFLMPLGDKWMGLVPRSTYTALENDGLVRDAKED